MMERLEPWKLALERLRSAEFADRWSLERIMPLWDEVLGLSDGSAAPTPDAALSVAR